MISKHSFFSLIRRNIENRLWQIGLSVLFGFFMMPVATMILINRNKDIRQWNTDGMLTLKEWILVDFYNWISIKNFMFTFLLLCLVIVIALAGFSYLHSSKKVALFHALPVRREIYYSVVAINGLLIIAIPYLIGGILSGILIMTETKNVAVFVEILRSFILHMAPVILVYFTTILAVMMTGHLVVSVLAVGIFFFYIPLCIVLYEGLMNTYFLTYYQADFTKLITHTSPFLVGFAMGDFDIWVEWICIVGMSCICIGLSILLYRMRPSESAGGAMAFKKTKFVIKCLLVVVGSLYSGMFFKVLFGNEGGAWFGIICGLLLGHGLIEIIYAFDFKRIFSNKKHLLLCAVCGLGIFSLFRFDLMGFDRYMPREDEIESAGIYFEYLDGIYDGPLRELILEEDTYEYDVNIDDLLESIHFTDKEAIIKLAMYATEKTSKQKGRYFESIYDHADSSEEATYPVIVSYHLTNGKSVTREYTISVKELKDIFSKLYASTTYKETMYPILVDDSTWVGRIVYDNGVESIDVKVGDLSDELLEAYRKDLYALTLQDRLDVRMIGNINFFSREEEIYFAKRFSEIGNNKSTALHMLEDSYPVYASFTNTLQVLEKLGIECEVSIHMMEIESMKIEDYESDFSRTLEVTNPVQMQEILDSTTFGDWNYTNDLESRFWGLVVTMECKEYGYYMYFENDRIPDFVKEFFEWDASDLEENFDSIFE